MKCIAVVLVLCTMSLAQTAIGADRPRNIFVDDWTPPKTTEKPRPPATVVPPPSAPVDPPAKKGTPTTPSPKPTPAIPAAPKPRERSPVPARPAQAAVRELMKEVYSEQLADRSIPARRKLTIALRQQADKSPRASVDQFVLLAGAIDAAIDAVDLPAALRAADRMAATFDIDGLGVKADAALRLGPKSAVPESAAKNVEAVLELSDDLAHVDDYGTAARICAALQPAAARDPALRAQLQQRQRLLFVARDAADRFAKDVEKLKASPDDPALNLAAGRYACLVKREWDGGLTMLAKGSDPALKAIAVQELAMSSTADAIAGVANGWWDLAGKQRDAATKAAVAAHAASLYERALDGSAGLSRQRMEKRIAEAASLDVGSERFVREIVVEAYINMDGYLHVTPMGIYWKINTSKPGIHAGHDDPTYVDGDAWKPKWTSGSNVSDTFSMKIGNIADFKVELVACGDDRGTDTMDKRTPIRTEVVNGEFVVTIPDGEAGAKWYRMRIFR
ncbi:MAG: hypothetical protein JWN40_5947 [Phycisphaerales bacterium]|nr:hypothetical protein [Phycisphaerales bacterium]